MGYFLSKKIPKEGIFEKNCQRLSILKKFLLLINIHKIKNFYESFKNKVPTKKINEVEPIIQ